jgi:hypothetical protein
MTTNEGRRAPRVKAERDLRADAADSVLEAACLARASARCSECWSSDSRLACTDVLVIQAALERLHPSRCATGACEPGKSVEPSLGLLLILKAMYVRMELP